VILAVLFTIDQILLWHIYAILFIRSLGGAFHSPTMMASTTLMIPEKHLSRVQGMNEILAGGLGILAPAIGAFTLSVLPISEILAIDIGTALLAITPLLFLHVPQPETKTADNFPTLFGSFKEGVRYLWSQPGLWMITLSHTFIYFLMIPCYTLLPILVTDRLAGGAPQLAWLQIAGAVGIIAGGLLLSLWGGFQKRVITMLLATVLSGVSWILVGISPANSLFIILGGLFLGAAMNSIMVGSVRALWQAVIPPEMQGRLFSVGTSLVTAVTPIGLVIAGPVADSIGVQYWFLIGGIFTAILGIIPFFVPVIMKIESVGSDKIQVSSKSG